MIVEIKQLLLQRTDNQPNALFPGGLADFITVHMTGNRSAGADAASHARWMYDNAPYSWHATVDDVEAWQQLPWKAQGWHAGDGGGPGNTRSIGIEICMNAGIDQLRAYENAAWIAAMLLRLGHGAKGIVQHNYWTGKNCPELIRAEAGRWERFLDRVRAYGVEEDDEVKQSDFEDLVLAVFAGSEERDLTGATLPRESRLEVARWRMKEGAEGRAQSVLQVAAATPLLTVPAHKHEMTIAISSTGGVIKP